MKSQIKLSVTERIILKSLMPSEGGLIEMMVIDGIGKDIAFTADEVELFELKDIPNQGVSFNPAKDLHVSYALTREQVKVLKSIPERLNAEKKVTLAMLPLFDLIDEL